ncbi:MAG: hypothetical protein ACRD2G_13530, partial [Terriglobia bacterium]
MSEVWLPAAGRNAITVRLEPNSIYGQDMAGQPALHLPLQMQLLPAGQQKNVQYQLVRLAGTLQSQLLGEVASFETGPLVEMPQPDPCFSTQHVTVQLDRWQIKRFEDTRDGKDAHLQITLSCLLWYPMQPRFEVTRSPGYLDVVVPRSHWVDRVLPPWNLSTVKLVEIKFLGSEAGEQFRASYARVEAAEKLFANGQWKQTLGELYSAFEALAKGSGFAKPDQQFFAGLLSVLHPAKKEKFKLSLGAFCDTLHLGRHE